MMDFSKVLITGADGMVGSYVDFGIRTNQRSLDVTDLDEAVRVVRQVCPAAIIHLAAETDVDRCERDPNHAYLVNSVGAYNMATAAPSLIGEQSKSFKGDEMIGEFIAVSSVILFWYCAYGFFDPFSWFFTAHNAICSSVVPYSFMCRLAISA